MHLSYYTAAVFAFAVSTPLFAQQPTTVPSSPATEYTVFLRGAPIGTEQLTVTRGPDGVTISGSSRLGSPIGLVVRKVEIKYDRDWRPLALVLDATIRDQWLAIYTTVGGGVATSQISQVGQQNTKTDRIAADAALLPNSFFGSYEAVAAKLSALKPGAELRAYIVPQSEISIRLNAATDEQLRVGGALLPARRYQITLMNPGVPLEAEVWADLNGSLLRLTVPVQSLDVVRTDLASVASRHEALARPGDEQVSIPAAGFNLAATISKPSKVAPAARLPAVVLVGSSDPSDRDETIAAVPIFAQTANALADAGFLVVRYDRRGVGQSGGRAEAATIADYAEDVRVVVKFVEKKRKDVDPKRIAVVGHGEGGWIALAAADGEKRIAALALIDTAASKGVDLLLEEQRHLLDRMTIPDSEKQARIDLQRRILQAVIKGSGWESIAPEVRKQADTPWFQSYLLFDPAQRMPKVRQPILILQADLDRQVPSGQADALAKLAQARKPRPGQTCEVVHFPDLNHLLVPATTGEVDEYGKLPDRNVSSKLLTALSDWLRKTLAVSGP
jgi:alpha-beta hydrolase superfamily lysophospholipase